MKTIKTVSVRGSSRVRVTVELDAGEQLIAVDPDGYVRLGEPMDDVMPGHVLCNSVRVTWCPIEQRWIS